MALQVIDIGNYVNDGTGDDLRTAFSKVNNNFKDLEARGGQANTISNVGTGAGLYKEKIGVDLRLKTLKGGTGITLVSSANEITIEGSLANSITTINTPLGTINATSNSQAIDIIGTGGVSVRVDGTTLYLDGYILAYDPAPRLNANLNLNGHNIVGGSGTSVTASTFNGNLTGNVTGNLTGNVTGLVYGLDVRNLYNNFNAFDFGTINRVVRTFPQLYMTNDLVDLGTLTNSSEIMIDMGTII